MEDLNSWDASSIMDANENFESYVGQNFKLIPLPAGDFEYWDKLMDPPEDNLDDEEVDETDEDIETDNYEIDGFEEDSSKLPITDEVEKSLEAQVREYIFSRYRSNIKGDTIHYGRAMFSVNMLVRSSIETYKLNPEKDIYSIIDYMFDYLCT